MIFICWGILAVGFVVVASAGHMGPPSLLTFSGALVCFAGVFFIFFRSLPKWVDDGAGLAGKGLALLFALLGATFLLIVLSVFLR
ncbi:hypothetical protein KNN17_16545 [Arthrobacter bambusae]|uniref:hypothetical protein n=1 Tax=Arthrobacter TaxID=1663 RepID=UPI001F514CB0|nr:MULTISPECIES: hypothetical protein [Arthrobacter]MCI0143176.1 hypothetical protein [Arthrobacter bambusae]UYY83663.1 hypothetical protein OIT41_20085 [Arthrobacter sp. YA7-1]